MKALLCSACNDVVAAPRAPNVARGCRCGRHFIWKTDESGKDVVVHDVMGTNAMASILRIANSILRLPGETTAGIVDDLLWDAMSDTMAPEFSEQRSLITKHEVSGARGAQWSDRLPETLFVGFVPRNHDVAGEG